MGRDQGESQKNAVQAERAGGREAHSRLSLAGVDIGGTGCRRTESSRSPLGVRVALPHWYSSGQ